MKKSIITILALLALVALSTAAMAAVSAPTKEGLFEFTLGGYVKMDAIWDSTQININGVGPVLRNNDPNFHQGRLKFSANGTRFNFNFKGPKLWGAQVTGLIEAGFDAGGGTNPVPTAAPPAAAPADTNTFGNFRLRHAMFRLNWPETELIIGHYWGFFSSFTPETANDAGLQMVGAPSQRLPQIRLTQKFLGAYTAAILIGAQFDNSDFTTGGVVPVGVQALGTGGASTETPQIQGMLAFEQDLWGKAAFYGVPRGFVAQLAAGWQRNRFRPFVLGATNTWGNGTYVGTLVTQASNQYLDPWMVQGSLFIPVIATSSANLAGTASLTTQWQVGQGLTAFTEGPAGDFSFFEYMNPATFGANRRLQKRFSGFVQGQYYFTNQWFLNVAWGMSRAYNVEQDPLLLATQGPVNLRTAANDPTKWMNQIIGTLWYRPITSLKFGLQYQYCRTKFFQQNGVVVGLPEAVDAGENHRVMFAGFFYF